MIEYLTLSIKTTSTRTWVLAFVVDASFRVWTIRILHAFWSATDVWIANVIGWAGTRTSAITLGADGVHSARRWVAGHGWQFGYRSYEENVCIKLVYAYKDTALITNDNSYL